jgi:hypothetical protein
MADSTPEPSDLSPVSVLCFSGPLDGPHHNHQASNYIDLGVNLDGDASTYAQLPNHQLPVGGLAYHLNACQS